MTATRYRRNSACTAREAGGVIFIATPSNDVVELNQIASAVWRLLETPRTVGAMYAVLVAAFPAIAERTIRLDLDALLVKLLKSGVIEKHER